MDEIGVPFVVTVDFQTIEDLTVTVRERDSMEQIRVPGDQAPQLLLELTSLTPEGLRSWESAKSEFGGALDPKT
eukprot:CAMPEP_0184292556 /NCGR_PEP_ID=MMETSP1049-20130417/4311_1 /TAXON_ID=77928 /ORGANISM="Proteomonas sulcata, Strain CCMP704" /LENGTH=73 /DNA_ID=CAMNT_0026600371 /DNA_START=315 /DNA_END=536 /DNA_ORIENTATION=-